MSYLITGAKGQLAQAFCELFHQKGENFTALAKNQLDLTHFSSVEKALLHFKPQVVINCSAYNLVDQAEEEPEKAYLVNEKAVSNLAALCTSHGQKLVHFSSDYVFDGSSQTPYAEEHPATPLNVYGKSKLLGEQAISKTTGNSLIFRSSWIYGNGTQNFIHKLLGWMKNKNRLPVAYDEVSIPNWTETIARVTRNAIKEDLQGLFHLSCGGYCSRAELARKVVQLLGLNKEIIPVSKDTFGLKAKRGEFLALDNHKLAKVYSLPHWEEDLEKFLKKSPFA